jgi:3-dehydroquinate dehydratase-1
MNENFKIAVSFKDGNDLKVINNIKNKEYLNTAELRVDLFDGEVSAQSIKTELEILKTAGLETILTIRSNAEGGQWAKKDVIKINLIAESFKFADFVDIELSSVQKEPAFEQLVGDINKSKTKLILSYHNFEKTPSLEFLENKMMQMKGFHPAILKIATNVVSQKDIIILTKMLFECPNLIAIGMGSLVSRVFFPAFGSLLTFAHLGTSSAPGQVHFDEMVEYAKKFYSV